MEQTVESGISNQWFWGFLKRWGWMLVLGLFLGAALGYFWVDRAQKTAVPQYTSEAMILINFSVSASGITGGRDTGILLRQSPLLAVKVKRPEVLDMVVAELPPEWGLTTERLAKRISVFGEPSGVTSGPKIKVGPGVPVPRISIPTFSIQVTDRDKERPQLIANALANAIIQSSLDEQLRTSEWLAQQSVLGIDLMESSLSDALKARNEAIAKVTQDVGVEITAAEQSLTSVRDSVTEGITELRTVLTPLDPDAMSELLTAMDAAGVGGLTELRDALAATDHETSSEAIARLDRLTESMATEYEDFSAGIRRSLDLVARITSDPDYQLAQARVGALEAGYEAEIRTHMRGQVQMVSLSTPLELLQPAAPGAAADAVIRKRDAMGIAGIGGVVIGWLVANVADSIRGNRRPRRKGPQTAEDASGAGEPSPVHTSGIQDGDRTV